VTSTSVFKTVAKAILPIRPAPIPKNKFSSEDDVSILDPEHVKLIMSLAGFTG
jgi:hypothetical protein